MKYVVFLGDGMADLPVEELNNLTPLDCASHPGMDLIAQKGRFGMTQTIPQGMPAGSDVANMSVLGYDPRIYYSGRSPFEALSIGIDLKPEDVTYRCNLVTLSEESQMEDATMIDYSAGEIDSDTARENIVWMQKAFTPKELRSIRGSVIVIAWFCAMHQSEPKQFRLMISAASPYARFFPKETTLICSVP